MARPSSTSFLKLTPGAHVAVIGGGPAGSGYALFALHFARELGLDLRVTIFEPRDFSRPGPWGCNMCAGLIPVRVFSQLSELNVEVPRSVIRERIGHYTLHTPACRIRLAQPDPEGNVVSIYRGSGPRDGPCWQDTISFDGFLLGAARAHGAEVRAQRVTGVALKQRPKVTTDKGEVAADLVVLANGANGPAIEFADLAYRPPTRSQMAQTEFCLGVEGVRAALGGSVHIFLPKDGQLRFGMLIPKGPCINVSLRGEASKRELGALPNASGCCRAAAAGPDARLRVPAPHRYRCGATTVCQPVCGDR